MKKGVLALAAVVVILAASGMAQADLVLDTAKANFGSVISGVPASNWGTYDRFQYSGTLNEAKSDLNTLWYVDRSSAIDGLSSGLSANVNSSGELSISSRGVYSSTQSFFIKVPFSHLAVTTGADTNSILHFGLNIHQQSGGGNEYFLVWGSADGGLGSSITGSRFIAGKSAAPPEKGPDLGDMSYGDPSSNTSGAFGLVYDAASKVLTLGYYDTTSANWVGLYATYPGWSGNVQLGLSAAVESTDATLSEFSVTFDKVKVSPVPVPPAILLLAPGLAGLFAVRRRVGK